MINKSIDYDLITDKVSIAMINHFKVYEDKLWVKDKVIADLRMKKNNLVNRCTELEQHTWKNTLKIEGVEENQMKTHSRQFLAYAVAWSWIPIAN